jgi:hypothetical protein
MSVRRADLSSGSVVRKKPTPVAERLNARVCGLSLAGVASSNRAGGMDVCVVCCTVRTKRQEARTNKHG